MIGRLRVLVPIAAAAALLAVLPPDAAAAPVRMKAVEITTVPPTPEARFALDDVPLVTDASGVARTQVPRSVQPHRIALLTPWVRGEGSASEFVRWYGAADSDQVYSPVLEDVRIDHTLRLRVAFRESRVVTFAFVDQQRRPVDIGRVDSIALRSDANQSQTLDARLPVSLVAVRPSTVDGQLVGRAATYSVQSVMIDGANVVNAGEQRFRPSQVGAQMVVVVLLRTAHLQVRDRLLGTPVATVVHVTRPDGQQFDVETDARGEAVLTDMARGTYRLSTDGQVVPFVQEVPLSRSQFVDVAVLTATDAAILATVALAAAGAILAVGWRRTRRLGRHRAGADGSAVDRADQVHAVGAR